MPRLIAAGEWGAFLVLEDNLRTPSGFAYAVAARRALTDELPPGQPACRPVEPVAWELLAGALGAAAPAGRGDNPSVFILSDGPENVAFYEHAEAARRIGATVGTLAELVDDGERVGVRLDDGSIRTVDVVYRRTNEDRVRGDDGELTDVAGALLEPWLAGRIGLVNGFGNGMADDKFVHDLVEECVRFYLGEEPLVRSVPTRVIDGRLEPRHVDLRLRLLHGRRRRCCRAASRGSRSVPARLVVNASQHGGGKDTRVLA